jgi:dihydropyrimidinase
MKKAEGKAVVDYGFHMIITDLSDQVESEMDALVGEGVTSFKLFMAYPGVFMLDDGSIFRRCPGREKRRHHLHARRKWRRHRRARAARVAEENGPQCHALTRPARGGRGHHRAIALAEMADVPTSSICRRPRRSRWSPRRATGAAGARKPVRNICFLVSNHEEPGFAGAKYV